MSTLTLLHFISTVQSVTVQTLNGNVVGSTETNNGVTINIFKGIPYAKPPVGKLRFERPQPGNDWGPDILDTTFFKPACIQPLPVPGNDPYRDSPTQLSEDCLFLNIWAPDGVTDAAVLVFFHGGGFFRGGAVQETPDGMLIAERERVLFVTVSYRLGPLGFGYLGEDTIPGNIGLLDQQMALVWIRDNIKTFGGNPNLVTIVGQEAGAASVGIHLLAPSSASLFNNAVLLSGSPTSDWATNTVEEARRNTMSLATILGCPTHEDTDTLQCLKDIDAQSIINNQLFVDGKRFPFSPVVDGYFLPDDPESMMTDGTFKNASVLQGVVQDEATVFILPLILQRLGTISPSGLNETEFIALLRTILMNRKEAVSKKFLTQFYVGGELVAGPPMNYLIALNLLWSDLDYKCPTTDFAAYYSKYNPVYMYNFNMRLSINPLPDWCGVPSGYQLELFLGGSSSVMNSLKRFERNAGKNLMRYLGNFAKSGSPNGPSPVSHPWPRYTSQEQYLIFSPSGRSTGRGLRNRQCNFINEILPYIEDPAASGVPVHLANTIMISGVLIKTYL